KHNLCIVYAVPAKQCDSVLSQDLKPAPHNLAKYREIDALLWKTSNRQRRDRSSAHRPHIVYRIKSCDATVIKRIVNNRGEKIDSLHKRQVISETVNPCVVGRIKTDNQIWIEGLFW